MRYSLEEYFHILAIMILNIWLTFQNSSVFDQFKPSPELNESITKQAANLKDDFE